MGPEPTSSNPSRCSWQQTHNLLANTHHQVLFTVHLAPEPLWIYTWNNCWSLVDQWWQVQGRIALCRTLSPPHLWHSRVDSGMGQTRVITHEPWHLGGTTADAPGQPQGCTNMTQTSSEVWSKSLFTFIPEDAAILIVHKAFPPSVSRPEKWQWHQLMNCHRAHSHGSPAIKFSFSGAWETSGHAVAQAMEPARCKLQAMTMIGTDFDLAWMVFGYGGWWRMMVDDGGWWLTWCWWWTLVDTGGWWWMMVGWWWMADGGERLDDGWWWHSPSSRRGKLEGLGTLTASGPPAATGTTGYQANQRQVNKFMWLRGG